MVGEWVGGKGRDLKIGGWKKGIQRWVGEREKEDVQW